MSVQSVYLALFGRPADPGGLAYWNEVTNGGKDLSVMLKVLPGLAEYTTRFEGMNETQVVTTIYKNLFGREPDATGLAFFTEALANGTQTIATIAVNILDGASGEDLADIEAKEAAANLFTESLDTPEEIAAYNGDIAAQGARAFLDNVDAENPATPESVQVAIDAVEAGDPTGGQEPDEDDEEEPGGGGGGGPGPDPLPYTNSYGDLYSEYVDEDGEATNELYAGKGNPANNFAKSVNMAEGIEVALDVRFRGDPSEVDPATGTTVWTIDPTKQEDLRFAYSVGAEDGLANYDYRLSIDIDGSDGEDFIEFDLGQDVIPGLHPNNGNSQFDWWTDGFPAIIDDGGDAGGHVSQNIQKLQWYTRQDLEAGDEYTVMLQAFEKGTDTVIAETEITIKLDGHTERSLEDFEGNSDMVLTEINGDAYGEIALAGGTAVFSDSVDQTGPFTRFDGYRVDSPDVVTTAVQIYIDPDDIGDNEGFDYSVAANTTGNAHMRDFIFHIAEFDGAVRVSANNNTNFDPAQTFAPADGTLTEGWYTFQHTMFENGAGQLAVEMNVLDANGILVFSKTLSNAADSFANFGGNRYGWFTNIDVNEGIKVDNWGIEAQYYDTVAG